MEMEGQTSELLDNVRDAFNTWALDYDRDVIQEVSISHPWH